MPTGNEQYCDGPGCGWLSPIVRTRLVKIKMPSGGIHVRELKFCKECADKEDKMTTEDAAVFGQPLVDTTEEIRQSWEAEQAKYHPGIDSNRPMLKARKVPKPVPGIADHIRRWFRQTFK